MKPDMPHNFSLEELKALWIGTDWWHDQLLQMPSAAQDERCVGCGILPETVRQYTEVIDALIAQLEWREKLRGKVEGMKLEPRGTTRIYVAGVNDAVAGVLSLLDQNT